MKAHHYFHLGAWAGLGATIYTNYRSAPTPDLQVAYLAVPGLMACVSEGLIGTWDRLQPAVRVLAVLGLLLLAAGSYEHLRTLTEQAGGTSYSANVTAGVIDGTIFLCVLATATLRSDSAPVDSGATLLRLRSDSAPVDSAPEQLCSDSASAPEQLCSDSASAPEQLCSDSAPVDSGVTLTISPRSGRLVAIPPKRSNASDAEIFEKLEAEFGQDEPSFTQVKQFLECGDSRAARLRKAYLER